MVGEGFYSVVAAHKKNGGQGNTGPSSYIIVFNILYLEAIHYFNTIHQSVLITVYILLVVFLSSDMRCASNIT